jgi:hypothetical protein
MLPILEVLFDDLNRTNSGFVIKPFIRPSMSDANLEMPTANNKPPDLRVL